MREDQIAHKERIWAYVTMLDKNGTPDKRINYFAYQNERPIFDLSSVMRCSRGRTTPAESVLNP